MSFTPVEPLGRVRTKIVATVGPASRSPEKLRALAEAGVDVFRLNFSHGTQAEHSAVFADIRALSAAMDRPLAVLQDLGGPKIRLGPIPGDSVACALGDRFVLAREADPTNPHVFTSTYRDLTAELKAGHNVLFADGNVAMRVVEANADRALLEVTLAGTLRSRQGINLPDAALSIPALTDKDLADLDWTARERPDFVALSFVRSADDVIRLRGELTARGVGDRRIVVKIEKPQALDDLDAILEATDAAMVARGDLGVEMDPAKVPGAQKRIIAACRKARVPVITATQMLDSMERSTRPTRAEATDVFNAVLDGTDAVMLSGETAIGAYPIEAVGMMSRIAAEAEAMPPSYAMEPPPTPRRWVEPITDAIVEAASLLTRRLSAALLVVVTTSGRTALALSKQRNAAPTLALTGDPDVARALSLCWGVTPIFRPDLTQTASADAMTIAERWARDHGLLKAGDRVVLVRGMVPNNPVHNAVLVHEVG